MRDIAAIVTDIEGTTTDIAFVHDVLFPYAARALPAFIDAQTQAPSVAEQLEAVRVEAGEPNASSDRVRDILLAWMAEDRKATPLKALQGMVWRRGYEQGDFTGHIYPDAAARLRAWSAAGLDLYVYSSGSEAAQRLLFGYSSAGDLTPLFSGYFDTRIGAKRDAASYEAITAQLALDPDRVLFLSDVEAELAAAATAGMRTCLLLREGGAKTLETGHGVAHNFDEVAQLFDLP